MKDVFVGIDVACARAKRLPICFSAKDGRRLVPLEIAADVSKGMPRGLGNAEVRQRLAFRAAAAALSDTIDSICREMGWRIVRIAIDAPAAPPLNGTRISEQALSRCGLSVFRTPDNAGWKQLREECEQHLKGGGPLNRLPHANKIWMQYGFEIFQALRAANHTEVLEVYPYSIVQEIARGCPHKTTYEGYQMQLKAISERVGWSSADLERQLQLTVPGSKHDRLDAFMSSWVASLPASQRRAYGSLSDPSDQIWVPIERNSRGSRSE
jgi:predicted nuclease with RNAse H fold